MDNSNICPIHGVLYAYCECEPVVYSRGGCLPNQRSVSKYLLEADCEEIGKVYRIRGGSEAGDFALSFGGKLYIVAPSSISYSLVPKKAVED
jgi:hypothetical protein